MLVSELISRAIAQGIVFEEGIYSLPQNGSWFIGVVENGTMFCFRPTKDGKDLEIWTVEV